MAEKSNNWSREQLLVAFNLYCQMPFGKLHARNPEIIRFAELIGRTPSALAMKLTNIASLDPVITSTGRSGLPGSSKADKAMWDEMQGNWEEFALESQATVDAALENRQLMVEQPATEYMLDIGDEPNYSAENKSTYTQIRVGQKFFRQSVISAYQGRCCITGLSESRLLVASHIIPWRSDKHDFMAEITCRESNKSPTWGMIGLFLWKLVPSRLGGGKGYIQMPSTRCIQHRHSSAPS